MKIKTHFLLAGAAGMLLVSVVLMLANAGVISTGVGIFGVVIVSAAWGVAVVNAARK